MFPYSHTRVNPKFQVGEETELRGSFYSSDDKELLISDKQRFCELLKIPFDSTWFALTRETVDSSQLPGEPTFASKDGRKFWLWF